MKLARATPASCHLWGTSIQLLRFSACWGAGINTSLHLPCSDWDTYERTCAKHPYARRVASALVAGVRFLPCSAGRQRLSWCFQTVTECYSSAMFSTVQDLSCNCTSSPVPFLFFIIHSPLTCGAPSGSDLSPVLLTSPAEIFRSLFLSQKWRGLIYSRCSAGPALTISPALIFSSPQKQKCNQAVIITITLLEEV